MGRVSVKGYWRKSKRGKRHFVSPYSRNGRERVPSVGSAGTWIEARYLLRWRDSGGKKRARYLPAHSGQMGDFADLTGGGIMRMPNSTNVRTLTTDEKATSTTSCEGDASLTSHVRYHVQGSFDYNPTFPSDKSCT